MYENVTIPHCMKCNVLYSVKVVAIATYILGLFISIDKLINVPTYFPPLPLDPFWFHSAVWDTLRLVRQTVEGHRV